MADNDKNNKEQYRSYFKIGFTVFVTFVCCILFFFFIFRYQGVAETWSKFLTAGQSIIIGLVLAYLMNPTMKFFEGWFIKVKTKHAEKKKKELNEEKVKKGGRIFGTTCALILLFVIIAVLIAMIVPSIVQSATSLAKTLPSQVETFIDNVEKGDLGDSKLAQFAGLFLEDIVEYLEKWWNETILPEINTYIAEITTGVLNFAKGIVNFIVGIIVAVYVMMIQEKLLAQCRKIIFAIFKPKQGNVIVHTIRHSSKIFSGFISGKILDSVIIGIICYIGCLIMRIPNSVLVAAIIGVTNVIPIFGPIIGLVPTVLFVVIQSPIHALYLLIFILVLQQVDGNIIGPKILGNSTGLSSFWVMFAILVFGGMWGFFGMLLGVPIFAVIYYIGGKVVNYGLKRRNLPTATSEYYEARGIYEDTNTIRYTSLDAPREKTDLEESEEEIFEDENK